MTEQQPDPGSIAGMFPEFAAMVESLLAERRALEGECVGLRTQLAEAVVEVICVRNRLGEQDRLQAQLDAVTIENKHLRRAYADVHVRENQALQRADVAEARAEEWKKTDSETCRLAASYYERARGAEAENVRLRAELDTRELANGTLRALWEKAEDDVAQMRGQLDEIRKTPDVMVNEFLAEYRATDLDGRAMIRACLARATAAVLADTPAPTTKEQS